jgi:hypothetical protein
VALAEQMEERHAWVVAGAAELDLGTEVGLDDQARWFSEAVAAFAAALGKPPPVLPGRLPAGRYSAGTVRDVAGAGSAGGAWAGRW